MHTNKQMDYQCKIEGCQKKHTSNQGLIRHVKNFHKGEGIEEVIKKKTGILETMLLKGKMMSNNGWESIMPEANSSSVYNE